MVLSGAGNMSKGQVEWEQDFASYEAAVADYGLRLTDAGTGSTDAAYNSDLGEGALRLAFAANNTAGSMVGGRTIIEPQYGGPIEVQARVRVSDVDVASVFFGLSDASTETNAVIIENEDGVLNTLPSDAVGFLLEGEEDTTWNGIWVNGDVDGDLTPLGHNAFDAQDGRYQMLHLQVYRDGTVRWYIDGALLAEKSKIIDPTEEYCFVLGGDARGTAYNVDLGYARYCFPRRR